MPHDNAATLIETQLITRRFIISAHAVQKVKALVEAYEGVAFVTGEQGGDITICAPISRAHELDEICNAIDEII